MQEMRAKMEQTRESVLRRNLSPEEYAAVEKHRVEMQSQKRVTVYKLNDKGELERAMLMVGISDGNYAQVMRGAEEGEKFVVRSTAAGKGVTQATYDAYRKRKGIPKRSVKELANDEIKEIYFNGYWRSAMCPEMPNEALATLMFDAAVNHGPGQAIKFLQQAAAVPAAQCDGKWGPRTRACMIAAAANISNLVDECLLRRERFYRLIVERKPQLGAFLRGWMNRLVSLRAYVKPLLIRAPAGGDTESALFAESPDREVLRSAPPDFSLWEVQAKDPDAIAAQ
jgi:hypothetical protein